MHDPSSRTPWQVVLRQSIPQIVVLMMVIAVLLAARVGGSAAPVVASPPDKEVLLSQLGRVDVVACSRQVIFLYEGDAPLMTIWTDAHPATLHQPDGTLVDHLNDAEVLEVLSATQPYSTGCESDSYAREQLKWEAVGLPAGWDDGPPYDLTPQIGSVIGASVAI